MVDTPNKVSIPVGVVGVVELEVVPVTMVVLSSPSVVTITADVTEVGLSGTHVNLPSSCPLPADLTLTVTHEGDKDDSHAIRGYVKINGTKFEFTTAEDPNGAVQKPKLEVAKHRLFGKGIVMASLQVSYPHCPPSPPVVLAHYDNRAWIRAGGWALWCAGQAEEARVFARSLSSLAGSVMTIGEPFVLALGTTGVAQRWLKDGAAFRLVIFESDKGQLEVESSIGYRQEMRFFLTQSTGGPTDDQVQVHTWLVGCTAGSTPFQATLAYQEPNEAGGYDFAYNLSVIKDPTKEGKGESFIDIVADSACGCATRPTLASFALKVDEHGMSGGYESLLANGQITGLHPDLNVQVEVQLWRRVEKVVNKKSITVIEPVGKPVSDDAPGGKFETYLYSFPSKCVDASVYDPVEQAYKAPVEVGTTKAVWAAMRLLPGCSTGLDPKLALRAILDWDPYAFRPFNVAKTADFCDRAKATWVCSAEATPDRTLNAVTEAQMSELFPQANAQMRKEIATELSLNLDRFYLDTPLRRAHMLAQTMHETAALTALEENLNYTTEDSLKAALAYYRDHPGEVAGDLGKPATIANKAYANSGGNTAQGDGYKYRGRGLVHLTKKNNYIDFTKWHRQEYPNDSSDFVANPDLVHTNGKYAARSGAYFWVKNKLYAAADAGKSAEAVRAVSKLINPNEDPERFKMRVACFEKACGVFGVK